jgi:serine/threonine protein phosphatase PrpC
MRAVPKWDDLPEDQYGIVKVVKKISIAKEDTRGWKNQDTATSNYMQDRNGVAHLFCGVFDGHGKYGAEVSQKAAERLPSHLVVQENMLKSPQKAFEVAIKATDADGYLHLGSNIEYSGATCVAVLVDQDQRMLHVANVGDSRAVLGRQVPDAKSPRWEAIALTQDQKPDDQKELERIELSGGHVAPVDDDDGNPVGPARVWDGPNRQKPGIAMSRTLGDGCAHQLGVISDPEVTRHQLTPEDRFMLIATDGLWDSLDNEKAVYICQKFVHMPEVALKALVKAVRDVEGGLLTDDTTIMLVVFS